MKNLYTLFLFVVVSFFSALGQGKVDYDTHSRFYLGFNVGATYHTRTEVDFNSMFRGAGGFTFGYSFGMKPNRLLSLDLQLRYLLGSFKGASQTAYNFSTPTSLDVLGNGTTLTQINEYNTAYGRYAPNFHTWVNDWSLELKLNTNRLRENTGWNFFVLGGIGYNRYATRVDFYDNLDNTQIKAESDLFSIVEFNEDYESKVVENTDWMPSFGLGIERQLGPNVAFSLLHRTTWTRNNDFDALTNTFNTGERSDLNDRYHITTAGIKFYLRGGKHRSNVVKEDDKDDNIVNPQTPVKGKPPVVIINQPKRSPITVNTNTYNLTATIHFVDGAGNITFTQNNNGIQAFNYNANTDAFQSQVNLIEGQNRFVIKGVNQFGQAQDETIIIYKKEQPLPPKVTITNPSVNPITVSNNVITVDAEVLHVNSKQNVSVKINGNPHSNFSYNSGNQTIRFNAPLNLGPNTIEVKGTNAYGQDVASTVVIYKKIRTVQPPIVTITTPGTSPYTTSNPSIQIVGTALHVNSKNNVVVRINGVPTSVFTFNQGTKEVRFNANLIKGSNTIEIVGTNNDGQDQASTIVIYRPQVIVNPPTVNFTNPGYSPFTANGNPFNVQAVTTNISSKNQIVFKQNGNVINSADYSFANSTITYLATLVNGSNVFEIEVTNASGSDAKTTVINYTKPNNPCTSPTVGYVAPQPNAVVGTPNQNIEAQINNHIPGTIVELTLNGVLQGTMSFNSTTQIANRAVTLNQGTNSLEIKVTNNCGTNRSTFILIYTPCTDPVITINNTNTSVTNLQYNFTGSVANVSNSNDITLKLNGNSIPFNFNTGTGIVSAFMTLNQGVNNIELTGKNTCGTESKQLSVTANPCIVPQLTPVSPVGLLQITTAANYTIIVNETGVLSQQDISVTNNGSTIPFTYNSSTHQITVAVSSLNIGLNRIKININNKCGSAKLEYQITRNPCLQPVLTVAGNGTTVTTNSFSYTATVVNVSNSNDISLKLNGSIVPFSFNSVTKVLTANLTLKSGSNTILLSASNSCGNASKSITVTSNPCVAPTIKQSNPSSLAVSTTNSSYTIEALTSSITNNNQISVKLNGSSIPFSFNTSTKKVKVVVNNLKIGLNTVLIEVTNNCGRSNITYKITRNPCLQPVLTVAGNGTTVTTSSFSYTATVANVSNSNDISLKLNGSTVPFSFNSVTKVLTANLTLKSGSNTILLSASNSCGNASKSITVTSNPCVAPTIKQSNPSSLAVSTTNSSYTIEALTSSITNNSQISVKLNGSSIPFSFNTSTKKVKVVVNNLKIGLNTVLIEVTNNCGRSNITYKITRNPCLQPVLTVAGNGTTVTTNSFSYTATVANVSNSNDISLKLNGSTVPFSFNSVTKVLTANLTLKSGSNTILLSASNSCGNASKSITVTSNPCVAPTIKQSNPSSLAVSTTNSSYTIEALTSSITNNNQISVKLNGSSIPFSFNTSTKKVKVVVNNLKIGLNTVLIEVTNNCGKSNITYKITRNQCLQPVLTVSGNGTTVTTNSFSYTATVANVSNSNSISLKLNGSTVPFSFNAVTKVLTANLTLKSGSNTILLSASNSCGNASKSITVTSNPCVAPTIKQSNPSSLAVSTTNSSYTIEALTSSITNNSQISVKLNGSSIPFSFNTSTKKVKVVVNNLKIGLNTVLIEVTNNCGRSNITYKITRNQCLKPVVSITNKNTNVTSLSYSLSGSALQMTGKSGITLKLNGKTVPFNFNTQTKVITANLQLISGKNTITLSAQNSCGNSSASLVVVANPCTKPVLVKSVPNTLTVSTTNANYNIVAVAQGVASKSELSVKLNGKAVAFTYSISSKKVSVNANNLKLGLNTLVIEAVNACGRSVLTYKITRNQCIKPAVKINNTNLSVSTLSYAFNGTVTGVGSVRNIQLKVNGVLKTVNFNAKTGLVTANLTLKEGKNTIQLIGTNNCGNTTRTITVTATTCKTPSVKIGYPTNLNVTTSNSVFVLTAKVTNVSNSSEIKVTNNGTTIPFTFNAGLNQVTVSVANMTAGANNIKIKAENACGDSSITYVIQYQGSNRSKSPGGQGNGNRTPANNGRRN